jgi:photosystem II stability/assembly factor-like uncharacterized protein
MSRARTLMLVLLLGLAFLTTFANRFEQSASSTPSVSESNLSEADEPSRTEIARRYGELPLSFEANEGQSDQRVKFLSRGPGYKLFLTATGAVLGLRNPSEREKDVEAPGSIAQPRKTKNYTLQLQMIGANPGAQVAGQDEMPGKVNYFLGNDPDKWRLNIPTYRKVRYEEVYPGIDLIFYGNQRDLEFDFAVAPGANPRAIRLRFDGADRMSLDATGDLVLSIGDRRIKLHKPVLYQPSGNGERHEIKGRYVIKVNEVRFEIARFDSDKPLIIDPVISYGTLIGSDRNEYAYGIAVDPSGNAYVTGAADSAGFPTTPGAFQTTSSNFGNAFVTKIDATGSNLIYSTYLGGSGINGSTGTAITVDASGNAHVAGYTKSQDFPTVNPLRGGRYNLLTTTDSGIQWSPGSIGSINRSVLTLTVDRTTPTTIFAGIGGGGGIFKSTDGGTSWTPLNLPVTNPSCPAVVIDPSDSNIVYASLMPLNFGGNGVYKSTNGGSTWTPVNSGLGTQNFSSLAIDPQNPSTIYAGATSSGFYKSTNAGTSWTLSNSGINSSGFTAIVVDPVTPATVYTATAGGVFKSTNGGSNWSKIISGLTSTIVQAMVMEPGAPATLYVGTAQGGVCKTVNGGANWSAINNGLASNTAVNSLVIDPVTTSTVYLGTSSGKILKTINGGSSWNVLFSGVTSMRVNALAINPSTPANVYAGTDTTTSSLSDSEAFLTKLNASGSALVYSTLLGGDGDDSGYGVALDSTGNVSVAGQTNSNNFPAVNAAQATLGGNTDAFVTKFNSSGTALQYSTYLGGSALESGYAIATDSSGSVYVTGSTTSANFPTVNPFQGAPGGGFPGDAFVTKLSSAGTLAYSSYLAGDRTDTGYGIAVDAGGNAYVTGLTQSLNFPVANAIQPNNGYNGNFFDDAFITKVNPAGTALVYSTYLGGSDMDQARGIAVDSNGNAYITGATSSLNFPLATGAVRTNSPLFKSFDGGNSWNNENFGFDYFQINALAIDPTATAKLYAGTPNGNFRSVDGGRTWLPSMTGLFLPVVASIVVNPSTPSTVYLTCLDTGGINISRGVYKSTNGGQSWNSANIGFNNAGAASIVIDPQTPSTLYTVTGSALFKTIDNAGTWNKIGPQTFSLGLLVIDPVTPTTLYAARDGSGFNSGLFKSTDSGANWQAINSGLTSGYLPYLAIDPVTPTTLYAAAGGGRLFKSTNGGSSWTTISTTLQGPLAVDPSNPANVYATGTANTGLFKSTDSGTSWKPVNNGLRSTSIHTIAVSPTNPSIVYVSNGIPHDSDAFVTKLNPSGNAFVYSTLIGGSVSNTTSTATDQANAIALDGAGSAYVAGASQSNDLPFNPNSYQPFNRGLNDVFVAKLANSYVISGQVVDSNSAPVSGVQVTLSDGSSLTQVFTESDGSYQFSRLREGGNFTVTASRPHFTVAPPSYTFNNLPSNQTANFTARATNAPFYIISGQLTENGMGLAGITVTVIGAQSGISITDGNGNYSFELAGGGNYTVTPLAPPGLSFTPLNQDFNNLGANQTGNFTATRQSLVVTNTNNHGAGSLRQAMLNANALPGLDTIVFNIPGSGIKVINLLIPLPDITDPVVVDATTQPGFAGSPLIEVNGAQAGSNINGFRITAGNSTIRGLSIGRFSGGSGILISTNGGNTIQGNYIGLDATGESLRASNNGITISSSNNLIGGTTPSARNVVSGNVFDGIIVNGTNNLIQGSYIGTNASGTTAKPNGINGIEIQGPSFTGNVVGGTAPGAGNLISGNVRGVYITAPGNTVQGNRIGTDATGTQAIGNSTGVSASAANSTVGGTDPAARNIISGNTGDGVVIGGGGSVVQGNCIGTDITGTLRLGNSGSGVVAGNFALVGGTTPAARNIISGNGGFGNVSLGTNSSGPSATVQGNYIGTDITGSFALNNPLPGISVSGSSNLIGGTAPGAGNLISGNNWAIQIGLVTSATLTGNVIQGNLIGVNATGTSAIPNAQGGIQLTGVTNNALVGGVDPAASNRISFNGGPAVRIDSGTGNEVRGNSIFANSGMGIDIGGAGVTANDNCDGDNGANTLQNLPVINSAISDATATTIQGTLNSTPSTQFRVDFYSNEVCDQSGNGEGQTYLGSTNVTTDGACNANFNVSVPNSVVSGSIITAVATNPAGNTSEFSKCTKVVSTVQFSSGSYSVNESDQFATITVNRTGDVSGPATIKFATSDATDVNFLCNPNTAGQITGAASRKCDYHIAAGRLRFAAGETSKPIILSLVNDAYVEGPETFTLTLTNPSEASIGGSASATITINDEPNEGGTNPIDGTAFYVRMLYVDLLSREPEPAGFAGWIHRIDFCGQPGEPPPPCDRVTVGGDGFLRSTEFFDREFFVIRLYRTALGRILRYDDVADLAFVSGFLTDADLELNKQEVVADIMSRSEFGTIYNSLGNSQYVDALIQTAGVSLPGGIRDGWVNALNGSTKTRAQVFRELSERPEVSAKYLHEAQVVSCYYGFFTRNPDGAYFNYLQRLDSGEINLGDLANAFINAAEYRQRFGP